MNGELIDDELVGPYYRSSSPTFQVAIYVGGSAEQACELCRTWVERHPRCVTVEPLGFVYTGGAEAGVRVKLINYPRFPSSPAELWHAARKLALHLLHGLGEQSLCLVATDRTEWISRRALDIAKVEPAP